MRCGGLLADSWFRAVAVRIVMGGGRFVPGSEAAVRRFACDATFFSNDFSGFAAFCEKGLF